MPTYTEADANFLRAASHPIRTGIVYELFARREATATEIARAIDEPVNSVSFHLRQLAKYDIVEEVDRPGGDARQRWWRLASDGWIVDHEKIRGQPGGEGALLARRRHALAWWRALLERFFLADHPPTEVWNINDHSFLLTDTEAEQLSGDLLEVMQRWRERTRERSAGSAPRRTYLGMAVVLPHQPDLGRVRRS